jgi:hypothetical protein
MYNTDFQVKYHDIETALLSNLQTMMEKKIAIASGTYVEVPKVKKAKKVENKKVNESAVEKCASCAACTTCSKKNNKEEQNEKGNSTINAAFLCQEVTPIISVVEPDIKTGKKAPKEKKETKKAKKLREEAEEKEKERLRLLAEEEKKEKERLQLLEDAVPVEEECVEDDSDDEDLEYTLEDVQIICDKLYRDELLSVFNVESTEDEQMDAGIKASIERLIDNKDFRDFLDDVKNQLIDFENFVGNPAEMENMKRNSEYLIFITMFSQKLFYLTHICLCQLFTVNEIDSELLLKIKEKILYLFKS